MFGMKQQWIHWHESVVLQIFGAIEGSAPIGFPMSGQGQSVDVSNETLLCFYFLRLTVAGFQILSVFFSDDTWEVTEDVLSQASLWSSND